MQMMYDWGAVQGVRPEADTIENQFAWGRRELSILYSALLSGTTVDAGSTPTTVVRAGLILGYSNALSKWVNYSPTATDGSQVAAGVLAGPQLRMLDINGNPQDKHVAIIVGGPVKFDKLFGLDYQARATMYGRFAFNDDLPGNSFGWRPPLAKSANYTLTLPGDNNGIFTVPNAATGTVTFTLPAPAKGVKFRFYNEAAQDMVIQGPSDTLVGPNGYGRTSCTFSTANQLIGSCAEVFANESGSNWIVLPLGPNTATFA